MRVRSSLHSVQREDHPRPPTLLIALAALTRCFYGLLDFFVINNPFSFISFALSFPSGRYDFFPRSWSNRSREDMHAFARHCSPGLPRPASTGAGGKAFIIKPDGGMQGAGITLAQDYQQVVRILEERAQERLVVQEYLADPLLLDGYKFDMRVYVLVQSLSPLKVFVFREGLARLCTIKYRPPTSKNIDCAYMHLTNYSLNKKNDNFHKAGSGSGSGPGRGRCVRECVRECVCLHAYRYIAGVTMSAFIFSIMGLYFCLYGFVCMYMCAGDGSSIGAPDRASKGGGGGGKAMLGDSMYDDMSSKRSISTALGQVRGQSHALQSTRATHSSHTLLSTRTRTFFCRACMHSYICTTVKLMCIHISDLFPDGDSNL